MYTYSNRSLKLTVDGHCAKLCPVQCKGKGWDLCAGGDGAAKLTCGQGQPENNVLKNV